MNERGYMENTDEECRGCLTFVAGQCDEFMDKYGSNCPCKTCIIKSMCARRCEEITKYIGKLASEQ